jgi:hypothetical protein
MHSLAKPHNPSFRIAGKCGSLLWRFYPVNPFTRVICHSYLPGYQSVSLTADWPCAFFDNVCFQKKSPVRAADTPGPTVVAVPAAKR